MSDHVFDAVLREQRDQAQRALVEVLLRCRDMDEDPPEDLSSYVTDPVAREAARAALDAAHRPAPRVGDGLSFEDLMRATLREGQELEIDARSLSHPDYVLAHQGRALGLQQAAMRALHKLADDRERVPA